MKLITAVLRSGCLEAVCDALDRHETQVISALPVVDGEMSRGSYRGVEIRQPRPRLRIEVLVVNDLAVEDAVDAIAEAMLEEGGPREGLLLVTTLDDVIRLPRVPRPPSPDSQDGTTGSHRESVGSARDRSDP